MNCIVAVRFRNGNRNLYRVTDVETLELARKEVMKQVPYTMTSVLACKIPDQVGVIYEMATDRNSP